MMVMRCLGVMQFFKYIFIKNSIAINEVRYLIFIASKYKILVTYQTYNLHLSSLILIKFYYISILQLCLQKLAIFYLNIQFVSIKFHPLKFNPIFWQKSMILQNEAKLLYSFLHQTKTV
jgi:hypothetical protein